MAPAAIGPVKAMLLELPVAELSARLEQAMSGKGTDGSLRALLSAFAEEHGIPL
jgi:phosphotransferase system enzyme I (PtsP)